MSKRKGLAYTAEQKTKIVLEMLKEESTVAQLASKHKVTGQTLGGWKKKFLENASLAFEPARAVQEFKDEIKDKQAEIDELQKQLGKSVIEREWLAKKLVSLVSSNKKSLVDTKLKTIPVTRQCELLGLSRASFYYKPVPTKEEDLKTMHAIDEIATENTEYGYRMIHQSLLEQGHSIGKDRVLKYMQIMNIQAVYPRKKKLTSIPEQGHQKYPYLLKDYHNNKKQVVVDASGEVWSGDITYIRMNGGFMYLAAIIDWHSKAILSYKLSNCMDAKLATDVLEEALRKYPKPRIFNSDQGSQYTSGEHTKILKDKSIEISMNGKGRSLDNIAIERFFRTLKYGNIYINDYQTIKQLKEGISKYMHKYNHLRHHSSIGYNKPMDVFLQSLQKIA